MENFSCTSRVATWLQVAVVATLFSSLATSAIAQEQIYFPSHDDAEARIVAKINAETVRLDIGLWLLNDGAITTAIINRWNAGVPVRVLGDRAGIFESDPATRASFERLASAGIPIRLRYNPTWFPEILHWKYGGFVGQRYASIGSANWTSFELAPVNATNFKDETVMLTNDQSIVNALLTMFDQFWVDTTYFLDWPAAYQRETGITWTTPMNIQRVRLEPDYPTNNLIWGQGPEIINPMIAEINGENTAIDFVSYRLTVPSLTDALIARKQAGVPVRVFIEPTQYRSDKFPEYWLVGNEADRLWVAGIPIKIRVHDGLTHMKTLITSDKALLASSNYTKNWQRDHNYFIDAATKPALYLQMKNEFNRMWNDTVDYTDFKPLKPQPVTIVAPGAGAINVSTLPKLEWNRAPWAVAFDVYLGTTPSNMTAIARVGAVLNESPPQTYSYTLSQALQPSTTYYWKIVSRTFATDVDPTLIASTSTASFTTGAGSGGGGASGPYGGTPVSLPGTIQAENFDTGGASVAYSDTSSGNAGGQYRTTDVDVESTSDTGGGYDVGWVAPGEWLKYTVNVTAAGTYTIEARVASSGAGGTFHIESNGVDKTGPITIPDTGGWQTWTTVTKANVSLAAGAQVWRVVFDTTGPGGAIGNLNYLKLTTGGGGGPATSTPYGGTPVSLPGTIQAENFDEGGSTIAYSDTSVANQGGQYRSTAVDVETTSDIGGGYDVGWVATGEWLNYTVNVTVAGTYDLEMRVASSGAGGTFHIEINGTNVTGAITIPNTGGWQSWTTVKKTGVNLSAGAQVWRVVFDTTGPSGIGNLNYIRVATPAAPGTPVPFGGTPTSLPGTLQLENFDDGGAGVAYSDTSIGNLGGQYRSTDVDVESTAGGGYSVGYVGAGEWLKYTVNVTTAGTYALDIRVASSGAGGTFHIEVNGVDKTGPIAVPNTGGWQTWVTVTKTGVTLTAGTQVWRLVMDSNGASTGAVGNFNWLTLR
jgi:phosphatidylserine/phosphatidylglycerophosphate/cardiolipin synthase-like enzyme